MQVAEASVQSALQGVSGPRLVLPQGGHGYESLARSVSRDHVSLHLFTSFQCRVLVPPPPHPCHDHEEVTPCTSSFTTDREGRQWPWQVVDTFLFSRRDHPEPIPTGRELLWGPRIPLCGKVGVSPWVLLSREGNKGLLQTSETLTEATPHLLTCQLCAGFRGDSPAPWRLPFFILERDHSFPQQKCFFLSAVSLL